MFLVVNPRHLSPTRLPVTAETHDARDPVMPHEHCYTEIAIVLSGSADHCSAFGAHPVKAGDAMVIRRGAWHSFQHPSELVLYNCYVAHDIMTHELAGFENNSALARLMSPLRYNLKADNVLETHLSRAALAACWEILDTIYQLARPHAELGGRFPDYQPRYKLAASPRSEAILQIQLMTQLLMFLEHLAVSLPPDDGGEAVITRNHEIVKEAVRLFSERPAHAWTLDELAATLHFNRSYLVRLFKGATGMPPLTYLFHLRAEEAAKLLVTTHRPVGEIGAEVGWTDAAYFAARFKAHFGISPCAYRARFQKL